MKFTKYLSIAFILFICATNARAEDNFKFSGKVSLFGNKENICSEVLEKAQDALEKLNIQINSTGCIWKGYDLLSNTIFITVSGESSVKFSPSDFELETETETETETTKTVYPKDYFISIAFKGTSIMKVYYYTEYAIDAKGIHF